MDAEVKAGERGETDSQGEEMGPAPGVLLELTPPGDLSTPTLQLTEPSLEDKGSISHQSSAGYLSILPCTSPISLFPTQVHPKFAALEQLGFCGPSVSLSFSFHGVTI